MFLQKKLTGAVASFSFEQAPVIDIPVVFRTISEYTGVGDADDTLAGQYISLWRDGEEIQGVGVHNAVLGMIEIPGRPDIKGITVGIAVQELLTKLGLVTTDMSIGNPGAVGPKFYFADHFPGLLFEVDAENGGLADDDEAWLDTGHVLEWITSRLLWPLSAIYVL